MSVYMEKCNDFMYASIHILTNIIQFQTSHHSLIV